MCGIGGIVDLSGRKPPDLESLADLAFALRHRGPDELGVYRDTHAGLAHTRLSIIDLATGQQPLTNEDGTLWLVFNGEIFNYVELRADLIRRGHVFTTHSDTEVIVHAYETWGQDAFNRFNGQYALGLWDAARKRLLLCRDPMGILPLYLAEHNGWFGFASEVKALFAALPGLPRALDPRGLAQTFTFWSALAPRSVFAGVSELEPGHVMVLELDGSRRDRAFFTPQFREASAAAEARSLAEATEAVRAALDQATRLRLRADVPVASYLSGGLDSSLVAALAVHALDAPLNTFSLRFEDAEYDESQYQQAAVDHLGTAHHELWISRRDIARVFPEVVRHAEHPILRTAPAPLYLLSQAVRGAGIKVVLTGEGADEMFAGYDLFREGVIRRFWARQPGSRLRPRLLERLYPYLHRSPVAQQAMAQRFFGRHLEQAGTPGFAHQTRWETTAALQRLFARELRAALAGYDPVGELLGDLPVAFLRWSPLGQDQYLEMRTLMASYLLSSQGDRMLMAHSVEGRFPYLDPEVAALAAALPSHYKLLGLDEKHILKQAARPLIPEAIWRRSKQPYRAPDALSFIGADAPEWVEAVLAPETLAQAGVFDPQAVALLLAKCRAHPDAPYSNSDNMALVGIVSTQLLHQALIATAPERATDLVWRTCIDRAAGAAPSRPIESRSSRVERMRPEIVLNS